MEESKTSSQRGERVDVDDLITRRLRQYTNEKQAESECEFRTRPTTKMLVSKMQQGDKQAKAELSNEVQKIQQKLKGIQVVPIDSIGGRVTQCLPTMSAMKSGVWYVGTRYENSMRSLVLQRVGSTIVSNSVAFKMCLNSAADCNYVAKGFMLSDDEGERSIQMLEVELHINAYNYVNSVNQRSDLRVRVPKIVECYVLENNGHEYFFYVMEFVKGLGLEDRGVFSSIEDKHKVGNRVEQIIADKNIVHPDLHPNNFIYDKNTHTLWLIDFGVPASLYEYGAEAIRSSSTRDMLDVTGYDHRYDAIFKDK